MSTHGVEVALSLGSNLGDRREHLVRALEGLQRTVLTGMEVSALWESTPVEVVEAQPLYLNICVVGAALLDPQATLRSCQALELAAGRPPGTHRQPRALDIDILYHGDTRSDTAQLQVPHPGLPRRVFVLAPLAELRGGWRHPITGLTVQEMLSSVTGGQEVRVVDSNRNWWCRE